MRKDRKGIRLVSGKVELTGKGLAQTNARNLFLLILAELAPKVFEDLANEPLRLYVNADLHKFPPEALEELWSVLSRREDKSVPYRITKFYESLCTWAQIYHLQVDWFVERGYYTLESLIH